MMWAQGWRKGWRDYVGRKPFPFPLWK
jgi:hypothetical protein